MDNKLSILDCMDDLFSEWFERGDWSAWRAFLSALFALPMDADTLDHYKRLTGRTEPPTEPFNEAWLVVGRRGGKSLIMALVAVYLACFREYRQHLSPGEVATIALIAKDRKQARTLARYIGGFLDTPMLQKMVTRSGVESFELSNRVCIEIHTASFRSIRGYTMAAAVLDEVAFWHTDGSATPDFEIIAALRPAMATIPGAVMLAASSPYAKRGELYRAYKRYHGIDGADVLTWQAGTRDMNPTVPESVITKAMERDADYAKAEYLAQFRSDLETFLSREVVEQTVRNSPLQIPFDKAHKYAAFVDPAGGGKDEFTLAIGHREGDTWIVDLVHGRTGVPASIVAEYAQTLKTYGLKKITGDRYAGSWPADEFKKHGIDYQPAPKPKSDLYTDMLPAINSGLIELPPDEKLVSQLCQLERRTGRSGKDSIDHPQHGSDDRANVIAGLVSCRHDEAVVQMFLSRRHRAAKPKPQPIRWDQPVTTE